MTPRSYCREALRDAEDIDPYADIPYDDAPPVNGPEDYGLANGSRTVTTPASFWTWMISAPATRSTGSTYLTGTTSPSRNASGLFATAHHSIKPAYSPVKAAPASRSLN